jgi:hypothetical protein
LNKHRIILLGGIVSFFGIVTTGPQRRCGHQNNLPKAFAKKSSHNLSIAKKHHFRIPFRSRTFFLNLAAKKRVCDEFQ